MRQQPASDHKAGTEPLSYLVKAHLRNSVKRTATSPRRLITALLIGGYFIFIIINALMGFDGSRRAHFNSPQQMIHLFTFIPLAGLWMISLISIGNFGGSTQFAEIEVLFPTPITQKKVLWYRLSKTMAISLMLPVFFRIVYAIKALIQPSPMLLNGISATTFIDIGLLALVFQSALAIALGYAYSLYFKKDFGKTATWEKVVHNSLYGLIAFALLLAGWLVRTHGVVQGLSLAASNPFVKILFFPAQLGTWMVNSPLTGSHWFWIGFVGYAALIVAGIKIAFLNLNWFYDISAARTAQVVQRLNLRKTGDVRAQIQMRAQQGKIKARGSVLASKIRVQGKASFIWREIALTIRQMQGGIYVLFVIGVIYASLPAFTSSIADIQEEIVMMLVMQILGIFYAQTISIQFGIPYFLQQTDLLKSLPFSCRRIVGMEVLAKSWLPVLIVPIACVVSIIVQPSIAKFIIVPFIFTPPISFVLSSVWYYSYLQFPDYADASQRMIRSLFAMAISAICIGPGVLFLALGWFLVSPFVGAVMGTLVNWGVTYGVVCLAGIMYDRLILTD